MRTTLLTVSALIAVSATAGAQATSTRLRIEPGSELAISGTSNVHDFHCKTNKFSAYIDVDPGYTKDLTKVARPIVSVNVVIAVKSLTCGNKKMDENMYSTLKADKNQIIKYTLSGYDILNGTATGFAAKTTGIGAECNSSLTTEPSDRLPTRPPPDPPTTIASAPSRTASPISPSENDSAKLTWVSAATSSGTNAAASASHSFACSTSMSW